MSRTQYFCGCLLLGLIAVCAGLAHAQEIIFPRAEVVVETDEGDIRFDVEVATNSEQRGRGLMEREFLAPDAGMLFLYESERMVSMWMKNTWISLDMLFMDDDGIVRHIATETEPLSLDIISSKVPAVAVLEIGAGVAQESGIEVGDRVRYEGIAQQ